MVERALLLAVPHSARCATLANVLTSLFAAHAQYTLSRNSGETASAFASWKAGPACFADTDGQPCHVQDAEKDMLASHTGLHMQQVNNWFINQRKRFWHKVITHVGSSLWMYTSHKLQLFMLLNALLHTQSILLEHTCDGPRDIELRCQCALHAAVCFTLHAKLVSTSAKKRFLLCSLASQQAAQHLASTSLTAMRCSQRPSNLLRQSRHAVGGRGMMSRVSSTVCITSRWTW